MKSLFELQQEWKHNKIKFQWSCYIKGIESTGRIGINVVEVESTQVIYECFHWQAQLWIDLAT